MYMHKHATTEQYSNTVNMFVSVNIRTCINFYMCTAVVVTLKSNINATIILSHATADEQKSLLLHIINFYISDFLVFFVAAQPLNHHGLLSIMPSFILLSWHYALVTIETDM